ncbi:MAG: MBOAT family protein, partial [Bacteroidetes bacterium]
MLFPSLAFLVFAAVFFLLWPWARQADRRRWAFLTGASLFFYGWWDWRFVFLIIFSGLLDFWAARMMARRPAGRRGWLALSLIGNLGSLSVFK